MRVFVEGVGEVNEGSTIAMLDADGVRFAPIGCAEGHRLAARIEGEGGMARETRRALRAGECGRQIGGGVWLGESTYCATL